MTDLMIGLRFPERLEKIELALADHARITLEALRGESRSRAYVEVRHLVWGLGHVELGLSYSRMARLYGRDHTSIINGVARAKESGKLVSAKKLVNERFPDVFKGV